MGMSSSHNVLLLLVLSSFLPLMALAQLRQDYYSNVCPNVEAIVRDAVTKKLQQTFITAPGTLRLFFHDCFVRGCDASVMISNPNDNDEKHNADDVSLAGDAFDTVIKAKAAVDAVPGCTNQVSCADVLAMAARDVVFLTGGPFFPVELGRLDGKISTKAGVRHNLPHPNFDLDQLNTMFASHGLTQTDMIALSGAHTIGFSHCAKFFRRIYKYSKTRTIDPTMNRGYALQLRQACPVGVDPAVAINMDPTTPQVFDNVYFQNLLNGMGLFGSDQVLHTDRRSRATVKLFAANKTAFEEAFATSMIKLGRVGVKTGSQGEVRRDCSMFNS
ncbi:hypothetical protein Taro_020697 [Colocasia esculenta]|uniref:Peroxidase n=1 Tax=Colocasia esculenta TaxID=4460 RepID=A0A843V989_COLES|nr:hypothetical protein [Colocasia esculenta]